MHISIRGVLLTTSKDALIKCYLSEKSVSDLGVLFCKDSHGCIGILHYVSG